MGNYNFKKDLIEGNRGEQIACKELEAKGYTFVSYNNDNKYDIKMKYKDKEVTFEVKTDIYKRNGVLFDTGNMAIEYKCRGKLSGISVTKADYFVYLQVVTNEMWICKVSDLKEYLKSNKDEYRLTTESGDDGSKTHLCLIKRNIVKKKFFKFSSVNLDILRNNNDIENTTLLNNENYNNMNNEKVFENKFVLAGKLQNISAVKEFASGFRKRTILLQDKVYAENSFQFELHKDRCELIEKFDIGDNIIVHFNVRCNPYNNNYYTNLVAWRIEKMDTEEAVAGSAAVSKKEFGKTDYDDDADLPF